MNKIITFINEKGGVGKSSCCFNLAWYMSEKNRVLMIDLDGQRANLTYFTGVRKTDDMYTVVDVIQSGRCEMRDAIQSVKERLDILPANFSVADLGQRAKISGFKKAIDMVKNDYDYIFIDVNPSPTWSHVLSLSVATDCIIVMLPDITSLEADVGIIESIDEIKQTTNPGLSVLGILFNKNSNRTNLAKAVSEKAEKMAVELQTKVFESKIRNAVAMSENVLQHIGITDYSPKSLVAEDIRSLADEIM